MPTIFYKTGGDFSTLTPQKALYANVASTYIGTSYSSNDVIGSGGRTISVTPSASETAEGFWCELYIKERTAAKSVTATLQEYVGSTWTDRVSKTLTYNEIIGSYSSVISPYGAHKLPVYFEFTSTYAVTASAGVWRVKLTSTDNNALIGRATSDGLTTNSVALISTTTTSYSASDNIITKHGITITVDQTITATNWFIGVDCKLNWKTSPVSAYTLTITNVHLGTGAEINIGTSTNRVPYAQQATITITNIYSVLVWDLGDCPIKIKIYGELPTNFKTTTSSDAASGQKVINTSDDMSAVWTAGDTLTINRAGSIEQNTIASISGKAITLTNNLGALSEAGYSILNVTKYRMCGVKLGATFTFNNALGNLLEFEVSGLYQVNYHLITSFFYSSCDTNTVGTRSLIKPLLLEYITGEGQLQVTHPSSYSNNGLNSAKHNGSIVRHRYSYGTSMSGQLIFTTLQSVSFSSIYLGGYVNLATFYTSNCTFSDMEILHNAWAGYTWSYFCILLSGANNTVSNSKFNNVSTALGGINNIFNTCSWDNVTSASAGAIVFVGNTVGTEFNSCLFGQEKANTYGFSALSGTYVQGILNNCKVDTNPVYSNYTEWLAKSYLKFDSYHQTTNDHRSWWTYGKIVSAGDGLTDTTVHTSGTGKYALRFEPTSSTNNLEWEFTIPTGNIQNKTMTIGVWVKINNANYYSGTHQLPRLTIDYDNGTTAYHQAGETTDWQLLFVSFTPTTTYGQITVTLSARTDQTTTNAYVYWDDFTVAYPPSVALDLGGMDNWSNGLPVVPPVSIPISANTVAESVWRQLTAPSWGTGSFGEYIKTLTPDERIKFIVDGELPLY